MIALFAGAAKGYLAALDGGVEVLDDAPQRGRECRARTETDGVGARRQAQRSDDAFTIHRESGRGTLEHADPEDRPGCCGQCVDDLWGRGARRRHVGVAIEL